MLAAGKSQLTETLEEKPHKSFNYQLVIFAIKWTCANCRCPCYIWSACWQTYLWHIHVLALKRNFQQPLYKVGSKCRFCWWHGRLQPAARPQNWPESLIFGWITLMIQHFGILHCSIAFKVSLDFCRLSEYIIPLLLLKPWSNL